MPYTSRLSPNALIIGDDTPEREYRARHLGTGFQAKPPSEYLRDGYSKPFPLPTIPREEWAERIEERERTNSKLRDIKKWAGFRSLNQGSLGYCWVFAPTQALHYLRAVHGFAHVPLSPASVGAPIKNYRNVGGWGSEALAYMVEHGTVPQEMWPATSLDRKLDNAETKAVRKHFKVEEFWELKPRNFDELATCLLYGFPVAVGYNWWGHEVLAHDLLRLESGEYAIEIDNSWGGWGDEGHGILKGTKALPDEAVAPRVMTHYPGDSNA